MNENSTDFRPLDAWERQLVQCLLAPDFPGRDALREQMESVVVRTMDGNGSLQLRTQATLAAGVERRIPTEGEAIDLDGTTIHYLLHAPEGMLAELEIYKDDSAEVLRRPDVSEIRVTVLGPG